jgi:hypothetical protein
MRRKKGKSQDNQSAVPISNSFPTNPAAGRLEAESRGKPGKPKMAAAAAVVVLLNPRCRCYNISGYCREGTGSPATKDRALFAEFRLQPCASFGRSPN